MNAGEVEAAIASFLWAETLVSSGFQPVLNKTYDKMLVSYLMPGRRRTRLNFWKGQTLK